MQDLLQNAYITIQNLSAICFMYLLNTTFLMLFIFFPILHICWCLRWVGIIKHTEPSTVLFFIICVCYKTPQKNWETMEYFISSLCIQPAALERKIKSVIADYVFLPNNSHQFMLSYPQADLSVRSNQLRLFLRVPQWDQLVFVVQLTIDTEFCLFRCSI